MEKKICSYIHILNVIIYLYVSYPIYYIKSFYTLSKLFSNIVLSHIFAWLVFELIEINLLFFAYRRFFGFLFFYLYIFSIFFGKKLIKYMLSLMFYI